MSVFDILKTQKEALGRQAQNLRHKPTDIFIRLDFDQKGAYIQTIDKTGNETQFDPTLFSGATRHLIQSVNTISDKNAFLIDWDNPGSRIYLHDYSHLIAPLMSSGLLVNKELRPVKTNSRERNMGDTDQLAILKLRLKPHTPAAKIVSKDSKGDKRNTVEKAQNGLAESYMASLLLQTSQQTGSDASKDNTYHDFRFIAENYAWLPAQNTIVETKHIGPFFNQTGIFNTESVLTADLPQYLSLIYSYIENIQLEFLDYQVQLEAEPLKPRPAIILERIDDDQQLIITIGQNLANTPIGFLDEYIVSYVASIQEIEKIVIISQVTPLDVDHYVTQIATRLQKYVPKGKKRSPEFLKINDRHFYIQESVAGPFIYNELSQLLVDYDLIGSEKLKTYKIKVDIPKLNLSLGHTIDFLEGTADLEFDGQKVSIMDAIQQYDKNRYIRLSDGTHALLNEQYINRLKRLFKKRKNNKEGVTVSFFDLPAIEELIEENQKSVHFAHAREVYAGFNTIAEREVRLPAIQAELRPYQLQGFQWISYLQLHELGGCLADDMGLGKTIQTIAVLAAAYQRPGTGVHSGNSVNKSGKKTAKTRAQQGPHGPSAGLQEDKSPLPSIIIMPKSLLFNWQNELMKFVPWLSVYIWYGQNRDMQAATRHQVILTTYAMFRNDIELWKEQSFLYGVLDESQAIKNLNSQIHKAVLLLKARHRLALSGTPVENNLGELYALFRFLNPTLLGSIEQFNKDYLYPIQKNNDKDAVADLRRKIYPFILRRLKKDVLTELPDKQEQTLYVEMNVAQAKYYEQRRVFYKEAIEQQVAIKGLQQSQFFIFQAMNELRQIASIPESKTERRVTSPKLETLMEQVEEAIANDHKILIFVNYLAAIETIGEALDQLNIGFLTMTGSTRDRQGLVDRFQSDPDIKAFIMTLKTGGTGLNLTAADIVFIFDPWWNKAAENQAIDRAHRIGQTSKVQSYKLITRGTIEEKIILLQEHKANLFDDIISADSGAIKSMSEEDIQFILG